MKTWVISDMHFDHTNIIKYCNRPFKNTEEMNNTLLNNWNDNIAKEDTVYFLGDLVFGKDSHNIEYWLSKLNGKIIFIQGSHDKDNGKMYNSKIIEYDGVKFLLIHNPDSVTSKWKGFVLSGHHHNHDLVKYPLFNKHTRKFNLSVELTNYKPVRMDEIIDILKEKKE